MKKIAIVALIATLTSCGGSETAPATTDSTTVSADTTKACCDSTKCDSTKVVDTTKK